MSRKETDIQRAILDYLSHTDAYPKYLTKYRAALDGWRYALAALEVK